MASNWRIGVYHSTSSSWFWFCFPIFFVLVSSCVSVANHNLSKIQAIIFDLDDTLYPQIEYKRSGFKVVAAWMAEKIGIDPKIVLHELEKILTKFGASYPYMFDRLVERLDLNPDIVPELIRVFIEHEPDINCFDGVVPMLERLRKKYRLGILTDGRLSVQKKKVKALGLDKMIDKILYSDELGLEKPAIELFQWYERTFFLKGRELIYVGDNPKKDFLGAKHLNWESVKVATGEGIYQRLSSCCQARINLDSVVDLERLLSEK